MEAELRWRVERVLAFCPSASGAQRSGLMPLLIPEMANSDKHYVLPIENVRKAEAPAPFSACEVRRKTLQ